MSTSNMAEFAKPARDRDTAARSWQRALALTATIPASSHRILSTVVDELAHTQGDAPALASRRENFSYRALAERAECYSRWALRQKLPKGGVVALLMPNRPEYMAVWLGITRVGGVVALVNTNL